MRILHFLQPQRDQGGDPLGHVMDLAKIQASNGHETGIIWLDEGSGFPTADMITRTQKFCKLGLKRLPIDNRNAFSRINSTLAATRQAVHFSKSKAAEILHGHGEKAGQMARRIQKSRKSASKCFYSPHGAPLNPDKSHWPLSTPENQLWKHTHGLIFDSAHCQKSYQNRFGTPPCMTNIIFDGIDENEFSPRQIIDMAADFLFVGSIDTNSGLDTLIQALARMKTGFKTGALIVGTGPAEQDVRNQVDRYGLSHEVFFNTPLPAQTAFLKGSCLVLPAKDASIPRIALLAAAAGIPMILTKVGGIPELIGDVDMELITPHDTDALQKQMVAYLQNPQLFMERATALKERVAQHFSLARMNVEVDNFYQSAL